MKNKEGFHSRVTKLELLHVHVATQITTMMHTYLIHRRKQNCMFLCLVTPAKLMRLRIGYYAQWVTLHNI